MKRHFSIRQSDRAQSRLLETPVELALSILKMEGFLSTKEKMKELLSTKKKVSTNLLTKEVPN